MQAVYDLSRYPANFNFVEFLVAAATLGANHVVFDDRNGYRAKFKKWETEERVRSILEPACALAGMSFSWNDAEDDAIDPGYHISAVIRAHEAKGRLEKLQSVLPPAKARYTVTIRNSLRYRERNSDVEAWSRFARDIGALVIEDYADKKIHLHDRMALYAGSEMNYLVANGPIGLLMFSDYPYTAFMKNVNPAYHKEHNWPVGAQLPWANERQRFIWEADDYANLCRHLPTRRKDYGDRGLDYGDCGGAPFSRDS